MKPADETVDETCEVVKMLGVFSDVENEVCGRCLPCMIGPAQIVRILQKVTHGNGEKEDIYLLRLLSSKTKETARCKGGRNIAQSLASSLLSLEYEEHVEEKRCLKRSCKELVTYRIIAEKCTMCGLCKEVCPDEAVLGEKYIPYLSDNTPYIIKAEKCTMCELCLPVCAEGAIEIV